MRRTIELLAPAKDLQTGIAAVKHGADAVYIAANKFGAREKAGNPIDEIEQLVCFAHQYFARVYVTVNTIIYEDELPEVQALIRSLHRINVDAIIIQDFAILAMDIPPIAIHASTQMHSNTLEKIRFLESQGVSRVVLPRELSVQEMEHFHQSTNAELEVFIHGALCVSYSGQCYMSQTITNRSANRGACAQPCRSAFDLVDADGSTLVRNKHLLSLKDLNLSQHIHRLIDAGVTSFKIEGRMKDIAYVKNTVAFYNSLINKTLIAKPHYRRASSGQCEYSFTPDPERSFNRGFTAHFIEGRATGQASYHSQKSVGKQIGTVTAKGAGWLKIASSERINNGDGLCFFNPRGELSGFSVNTASQGKVFPSQEPDGLSVGTAVFRNSDTAFERTLRGESSTRKVWVAIAARQEKGKLWLTATDEDAIRYELAADDNFEPAKNPLLALESTAKQLAKVGETIFRVKDINLNGLVEPRHIPLAALNTLRRNLLNGLLQERLNDYSPAKRPTPQAMAEYPLSTVDYKGNVANSMSKKFLEQHGAKSIADAFELGAVRGQVEVMTTKYCIKYELGLCPSKQRAKPTKALFLRDNRNLYPLVFNCKECQMCVMSPVPRLK